MKEKSALEAKVKDVEAEKEQIRKSQADSDSKLNEILSSFDKKADAPPPEKVDSPTQPAEGGS